MQSRAHILVTVIERLG
uniref:Uncharacterized protein n=1 Tax=Anguilla anguilla TaxID=7936 RepID=A0A0E9QUL7_ANGAN